MRPPDEAVVSEDEQNRLLEAAGSMDFKYDDMSDPRKSSDKPVRLRNSIHESLTGKDSDRFFPTAQYEQKMIENEHLKWQIDYEKKLHHEVNSMLENRVSKLMAEIQELQKQNNFQTTTITDLESEKAQLTANLETLEK